MLWSSARSVWVLHLCWHEDGWKLLVRRRAEQETSHFLRQLGFAVTAQYYSLVLGLQASIHFESNFEACQS